MNNNIAKGSSFFYNVLEEYKRTNSFMSSRIKQDLTKEVSTKSDYRGREIFELLQNAEDEKSEYIEIHFDSTSRTLSISNGGSDCTPFTEEGFCSIMMAEMSPKLLSKQTYIGCKGLGFRSLLNWSDAITIYSSGVRCSFSEEIALRYWNDQIKDGLSEENVAQHELFAKESLHLKCPVSILAIPDVEEDKNCNKGYSTKIEIEFKKECEQSIIEQIRSLSGKVLLFLTNIQTININLNGELTYITKEKTGENTIRVKDSNAPNGVEYTIYKESGIYEVENKIYEVCIAYDKNKKEKGNYIYTFFPTKVRIDLPCVIHATFDLNSSRNSLNETETNNWMQRKIAACLSKFCDALSSESQNLSWEYLELLNLNSFGKQDFPFLYDEIKKVKDELKIFPTIKDGYCRLADTVHFSEDFANLPMNGIIIFDNHLIGGYSHYGISNQPAGIDFINKVNQYSRSIPLVESEHSYIDMRANLIYAVSTVLLNNNEALLLLIDNNGKLIENEGKINVGENILYLPKDMQVSYVSEELISALIEKFAINESNSKRGLTRKLKKCGIDVSDMDLNAVKKRIISYSKNEMKGESYAQLMYALYNKISITDSSGLEDIFTDCDFRLIAKSGTKHYPSELVISTDSVYNNSQMLLYDIDEWVAKFKELDGVMAVGCESKILINFERVKEFFYDTVFISHTVPMQFVSLDNRANEYLNKYSATLWKSINDYRYYYSKTIEEKQGGHHNRYCLISASFIDQLVHAGKSLSKIISIIMSDCRAMQELKKNTLYFQQRSLKSEEVEVSYPLYKLRNYKPLNQLSMYILAENIMLNGDVSMEHELLELSKNSDTQSMLLLLGAKPSISVLNIDELYHILEMLPEKRLTKGVQKLYKSIREAINVKRSDGKFASLAEEFRKNGKAYARKNSGKLEIKPIEEIYYWDNEQLPHNILSTKYKLELPNRVGEESVKEIFGVRLAKDILITIKEHNDNTVLSREVLKRIQSRIRYLLAYRLQNSRDISDSKDKIALVNSLRNIQINIYSSCRLSIDDTTLELKEGDMVSTKNGRERIFHVCATITDADSSFKYPSFCENITEAVCITLKVTSSEMANCFRSILKNSIEENDFIGKKEVSLDIWEDVDKAVGISNEEKSFWKIISQKINIVLDMNMFTSSCKEKIMYLRREFPEIIIPDTYTEITDLTAEEKYKLFSSLSHYGIDSTEMLVNNGLTDYYQRWLHNQIMIYKDSFSHNVYNYVKDKNAISTLPDPPMWYYDKCMEFTSGSWLNGIIEDIGNKILLEQELESKFNSVINQLFETFIPFSRDDHWQANVLEPYSTILAERYLTSANIDQREMAYTFFEGYEEVFKNILEKHLGNIVSNTDKKDNGFDVNSIEFNFGKCTNKLKNKNTNNHIEDKRRHGGRYSSDREKQKAGLLAEQKVFQYLCINNEIFTDISGCSRNLDPTNGNDNLHYDILYSIIENGEKGHCRYLEVKSMSGDSIIMTQQEYQFAMNNAEFYDFAVVNGNSITILRSPFLPNEEGLRLQVIPETYVLTLDIKKEL